MLARSLVVLLVAMNLGAAAWWIGHRAPPPAAPPPPPADVPALVLLSEAEPRDLAVPEAETAAAPEPLTAAPLCLSLGPLQTPADARRIVDALGTAVARSRTREVAGETLRGYRVYLPASPTREAALATARELAARGIQDYYVVTAGAQQNTVALGLFRDLSNAEARRDAVRALGYAPVLEPRTEPGSQWWVDIAAAADFDWRAGLGGYSSLQARAIDCF
ncbi:SPOR domain-containing protein [Coralloluteibacterium stylophorae]|uniref:SPOR domain-containing protein n=1 Tax=Coralloluteibacterium stylophorae TaxID=1776034 RepID=A0A8J8AY71_9GAMM|nr:SPOR domain-containing protein [Coralloluteibacterium stylophorae]MBS7458205.1 SPOR domain-containing protein [Coralloluteibacterium stylophorae]